MMKNINKFLLSILFLSGIFMSCENEEENFGFTPGEDLLISGPAETLTFSTETFYVEGFTVDETYSWSISGDGTATVTEVPGREGEFVSVSAEDVGNYTLTVSNGTLEGSTTFAVEEVNEFLTVSVDTVRLTEDLYTSGGDTLSFPINITERNVFETTATFSINEISAVEGVDFEILNESNVLTFAAGETTATVDVLLNNNLTVDGSRTFAIVLESIQSTGQKSAAVELAPDSLNLDAATFIVTDEMKTVGLNIPTDSLGVSSPGNYFVEVALNRPLTEDLVINYTVNDGSGAPQPSADKTNGSVTIFAGNTMADITLFFDESRFNAGSGVSSTVIELQSLISNDQEVQLGGLTQQTLSVDPGE